MRTITTYLILASSFPLFGVGHTQSLFDEFFQDITHFETQMQNHFSKMRELATQHPESTFIEMPEVSITENKKDNTLVVALSSLQLINKQCDASYDADTATLDVQTNAGNLALSSKKQFLIANFNYQNKQHAKEGKESFSQFEGYSRQTHSLTGPLLLDQAQIEYDAAQKRLLITIPYKAKTTTKLPIAFKEHAEEAVK